MAEVWRPDRAAGLERIAEFAPSMGRAYAETRSFDFGPGRRDNVSRLSPWLRHRLILEEEVLAAALRAHGPRGAEKFIEEVFWRAYFRGWLERRPAIWRAFRREVDRDLARMARDPALFARYDAAVSGRAGIEGFDDWARELTETGWLHNHARMWFASIWIFTLRLPWALGADFFLRHLTDGDPASNTLGWRWVAGLHTRGKTYLARAANIETFTEGRFRPSGLATAAEPPPGGEPPASAPAPRGDRYVGGRFGLLLTGEDCCPESLPLPHPPEAVLGLSAISGRSPLGAGAKARAFAEGALADALARAETAFGAPARRGPDAAWRSALIDWAREAGVRFIAVARPSIGPAAALLDAAEPELEAAGLRLVRLMRRHDEVAWPHADKGFFAMRREIPRMLAELGLG